MRFIDNYGSPFAYDLINYYIFSSLGRSHHKETDDLTSHPCPSMSGNFTPSQSFRPPDAWAPGVYLQVLEVLKK